MKAAVCREFGKPLTIEEMDIEPPKDNEVQVKVAVTAICHSDINVFEGNFGGPEYLPLVAGHETAGYVDKVGKDVTSLKVGDRVVCSLLSTCGKCYYCRHGMGHMCEGAHAEDAVSPLVNAKGERFSRMNKIAGFAEYVNVDSSSVIPIGDMDFKPASIMACGVVTGFGAAVNRMPIKPLSAIAVIGTGGVGLNTIQGATFVGAYPLIAVDVVDKKLEAAKTFGATHGVNAAKEDAVEAVRKLTDGKGADVVYVTVGSTAAIPQAMAMTAKRGTVVLVGLPPLQKSDFSLSVFDYITTERCVTGAFMGSANLTFEIPRLIKLYKAGRLKLDELISGTFAVEKINEAIKEVETGQALRNVIKFSD